MKFFLFLFLLFSLLSEKIEAQNDLFLKETDAVIIHEENEILINGCCNYCGSYTFKKKQKVFIKSAKAIERFSKIVLPEALDPNYLIHAPDKRNYQYVYKDYCFCDFEAIKLRNNDSSDIPYEMKVNTVYIVEDNKFNKFNQTIYTFSEIEVGDTIEIKYCYSAFLSSDIYKLLSMRIFFNSDVYKEKTSLKISQSKQMPIEFKYFNEAEPDSVYELDSMNIYTWSYYNLPGCVYELNSRPYRQLPYITFTIRPFDAFAQQTSGSNKFPIPYYEIDPYKESTRMQDAYTYITKYREDGHLKLNADIELGIKTKQYREVNRFIESYSNHIHDDSSGYLKLLALNNEIADNFTFQNDTNYFKNKDTREPRFGDFLAKGIIRDRVRYDPYVAIVKSMGLNYVTAYLLDKRAGIIDKNYFTPMLESDYLVGAILKNNEIAFIYPKSDDFSYYLNELPFYYENTLALLIGLNNYIPANNKIDTTLYSAVTPKISFTNNTRTNNILVDVDLNEHKLSFKSKIQLKGQFSTMCRGSYLKNFVDKSVNPLYSKKIWEINDKVILQNKKVEVVTKEPPFTANINADYIINELLCSNNDTISISMNNLFGHIIEKNLDFSDRNLDYFPDFTGSDTYVYFLKFSEPIEMINTNGLISISNNFGKYEAQIEQIDSKSIKVSSYFAIVSERIPFNAINDVQEVYRGINNMNDLILKVLKAKQ